MIKIEVHLIAHTPNPERVCAAAAWSTFSKKPASHHVENLSDEKAHEILRKVVGYGHHSVIEHANFTFSVEGVSRVCTHQIVRHRLASYSQQSQRYVAFEDGAGYVTPPSLKDEKLELFEEAMQKAEASYKKLLDAGVKAEDARFVLPNAGYTNIVITMNARELMHFFKLRCCTRAQWEIRQVADEMLKQAKAVAPVIFEKAGASCDQTGYCPEGEFSCGRAPTLEKLAEEK